MHSFECVNKYAPARQDVDFFQWYLACRASLVVAFVGIVTSAMQCKYAKSDIGIGKLYNSQEAK